MYQRLYYFNPLSPCGKRRGEYNSCIFNIAFQSTLPVWEETLDFVHVPAVFDEISIHSPRVGRDVPPEDPEDKLMQISIHSPRVGRDLVSL